MKLYYFSEMPHHEFPDAEGDQYPSLRLAFPNTFFSPEIAQRNYQRYLDEYDAADQAGFDGLMINEHHSTPSCVNVSANMIARHPGPDDPAGEDLDPGQHPADPGQPGADGRADGDGRPDLGRAGAERLRARRRGRDLVGEQQPGPQPRALRGVPRPDHQVLDHARARSAGRAGTTTSATSTRGACRSRSRTRRSGCRAPRARRRRCGPGAWATPTCRSWCRCRSPGSCSTTTARARPRPGAR